MENVVNASNPLDTLQQVAGCYGVARCLHVIADFGISILEADAN